MPLYLKGKQLDSLKGEEASKVSYAFVCYCGTKEHVTWIETNAREKVMWHSHGHTYILNRSTGGSDKRIVTVLHLVIFGRDIYIDSTESFDVISMLPVQLVLLVGFILDGHL